MLTSPSKPELIHPGWLDLMQKISRNNMSRRKFLTRAMAAAGGLALWQLLPLRKLGAQTAPYLPDQANWQSNSKIKHVVIMCQENRSFDHYFGSFASMFGSGLDRAEGFNPDTLTYLDSSHNKYHPYHLTDFCDQDPDHSWADRMGSGTRVQ